MIAALSAWHDDHDAAARALEPVTALPAHVVVGLPVLTRLPAGLAVPAASAAGVLAKRFHQPPLRLADPERDVVLRQLASAGIIGGATYDGLVAMEAKAHGCTLLTLDFRAQLTYQRVGVAFRMITA